MYVPANENAVVFAGATRQSPGLEWAACTGPLYGVAGNEGAPQPLFVIGFPAGGQQDGHMLTSENRDSTRTPHSRARSLLPHIQIEYFEVHA
jgi:hypothetical protein